MHINMVIFVGPKIATSKKKTPSWQQNHGYFKHLLFYNQVFSPGKKIENRTLKGWRRLVPECGFFRQKKPHLRWLWTCVDFWVFELRLQPSSQKASKLLGKSIGAHYMGARAVARPETVLPPICITKMFENPLFLSLPFWRAARAQLRARPYNFYQFLTTWSQS